jgi:hypothetical protein
MHTNVTISRLLVLTLVLACFVRHGMAGNKGIVIATGGGNGRPEIYETWKKLGGGKNAQVVLIPTANNPSDDIAPAVNGRAKR